MATADGLALDAIAAAQALGLRVPGDLAVVGFGGTQAAVDSWPSLTTAGHSFADFGEVAVRTLAAVAEHGRHPDVVLSVELTIGTSCGCGG
jgi:LacI family transcriptional regulator